MQKKLTEFIVIFCLFLLFLFFLGPGFVFALEIDYPQVPGAVPPQEFLPTASPEEILPLYVFYIFNLVIWLSGIIAFGIMVYAGIRYLTSVGKPEAIASARDQISSAFLGILILLSSVLILRILNPQLVVLEMPEAEPVKIVERPETPPPLTELYRSSINTEIPFAAIIDKIFEEPRMTRIKKNSQNTLEIAEDLNDSNKELNDTVQSNCCCCHTDPQCNPCVSGKPCTCDPCEPGRDDIEKIQNDENLPNIEKLRIEQEKTIEEIRLLNIELDKLVMAEKFMLDCPLWLVNSLAEFLDTKKFYISHKWPFLDVKFLEEIETIEDWGSFYCPVSGSIWGEQYLVPTEEIEKIIEEFHQYSVEPPEEGREMMACTIEVPVGEIIDRTKRVARFLVSQMKELVEKDKEMIEAVDEMQVLVSQCSSKNCVSSCTETDDDECIEKCVGTACPFAEIKKQAEKIDEIKEKIKIIVGCTCKKKPGIITVIDQIVPKIIEDLNKEVRKNMKECISETSPERPEALSPIILSDCESALRAVGLEGKTIQNCCLEEPEFQKCLDECYLEREEDYKKCLEDCLRKESENLKKAGKIRESEIIATCKHRINFYCCGK